MRREGLRISSWASARSSAPSRIRVKMLKKGESAISCVWQSSWRSERDDVMYTTSKWFARKRRVLSARASESARLAAAATAAAPAQPDSGKPVNGAPGAGANFQIALDHKRAVGLRIDLKRAVAHHERLG